MHLISIHRSSSGFQPRPRFGGRLASAALLAVCAACSVPRRAPLHDVQVAAAVDARAAGVDELRSALELADLGPLAVPTPSSPAALDPADPGFWRSCAFAYEPGVRQARRRLQAERARARGAGVLESIGAEGMGLSGEDDRETEATLTFDLLALLGLGPSAAARELARSQVCEALGDLEAAVWSARFRVDRALVRLRAALAREAVATGIAAQAVEDEPRISILEQNGRSTPADIAWARATLRALEQAAAEARAEQAEARAELAIAAGLSPDHPALGGTPPPPFSGAGVAVMDAGTLLSAHPRLRALKLRYAVAEARVRSAVAEAWPGLEIGPRVRFVPDDVLAGGVVALRVPTPAAVRPMIDAAVIERMAARDAVEDGLLEVLARNRALERRLAELSDNVLRHVRVRLEGSQAMWRASRARFGSDENALGGWNLALEALLGASLAEVATHEAIAIAALDLAESCGPDPRPAAESRAP